MSERINQSPETESVDREALERAGLEKKIELNERLEARAERKQETSTEKLADDAREKAEENEAKSEKAEKVSKVEKPKDTPRSRKKAKDASFNLKMKEVQSQMSTPSRTFSKVIHNKAVEKTSEVVGATVARPNAFLAGAISSFIFTLAIYLVAKHYGYPLSGFETIGAFIVGWLVGILFDYLRIMITGKRV